MIGYFVRMDDDAGLVYGLNPVLALLADPGRPVEGLSVQDGAHGQRLQEVWRLARERGLRPRLTDRRGLDKMTGGAVHQGVVARVGVRRQPTWEDLLQRLDAVENPLLVLLDEVSDPHNLGAVIRSAEAFGALAVVVPKDRSAPLSAVAVKASAGAGERLDVVRVTNLARAIGDLQAAGVRVYGLAAEGERTIQEADLAGPVALVFGSEGRGLRRLTRERCDGLLSIPIGGGVASLNVSVAAGIALYEVRRRSTARSDA